MGLVGESSVSQMRSGRQRARRERQRLSQGISLLPVFCERVDTGTRGRDNRQGVATDVPVRRSDGGAVSPLW